MGKITTFTISDQHPSLLKVERDFNEFEVIIEMLNKLTISIAKLEIKDCYNFTKDKLTTLINAIRIKDSLAQVEFLDCDLNPELHQMLIEFQKELQHSKSPKIIRILTSDLRLAFNELNFHALITKFFQHIDENPKTNLSFENNKITNSLFSLLEFTIENRQGVSVNLDLSNIYLHIYRPQFQEERKYFIEFMELATKYKDQIPDSPLKEYLKTDNNVNDLKEHLLELKEIDRNEDERLEYEKKIEALEMALQAVNLQLEEQFQKYKTLQNTFQKTVAQSTRLAKKYDEEFAYQKDVMNQLHEQLNKKISDGEAVLNEKTNNTKSEQPLAWKASTPPPSVTKFTVVQSTKPPQQQINSPNKQSNPPAKFASTPKSRGK